MEDDSNVATQTADTTPRGLSKAEVAAGLLDCITELVVQHDPQMRIIWANKAACDSVGMQSSDLIGRHCYEVWHNLPAPCPGCPLVRARETGQLETAEMSCASGRVRLLRGYPVKDAGGDVINVVGVTTDITDARRVEQGLRESEENYRKLVEQSLQGIVVLQDMRVVFANQAIATMVGLTVEEITRLAPEQIKTLVHPHDRKVVWERYTSRISGKQVPQRYELRGVRKDGSIWWAEVHSNLITYDNKPAIQCVLLDITDRKRTTQALRDSEEKFSNLFHNCSDAILIHDLDGNIVDVNQRCLDLFGYQKSDILTLNISRLHPVEALDESKQAFATVAEKGFVSFEIDFRKKDGEVFPAEVSSSLFEINGKKVIQGIVRDITERRLAERALRDSEERHRALVENINEIIFTLDTHGHFSYISPVAERILGYTPDEITGQPFNCFVHPDDTAGVLVAFDQSFSCDTTPHEFRILDKTGTTHYVRASCRPLLTDGRVSGLTGIMADITESKIAGAVLRESEEMYETLVKATTDAVFITDLQGNITEASHRALELFACERFEDLVGRSEFEFIVPADHQRAMANLKKALKQGSTRGQEYGLIRNDGTRFVGRVDAALIRDAEGDPKAVISAARDITERKRAEKALRRSEQRFTDIAETASEWIWEVDAEGVYTYSSPAIRRILGYEPEEMLGRHFYDFYHPEGRDSVKEAVFDTFASKKPFRGLIKRLVHKNGKTIWLSTNGVPIVSESGNLLGYRGADTDITRRKGPEEQLSVDSEGLPKMLNAVDDGVIVTDPGGKVVAINKPATSLTGWDEQNALGQEIGRVFDIRSQNAEEAAPDPVRRILDTGTRAPTGEHAALRTRDGGSTHIAFSSAPIAGQDGGISGIMVIFKSISQTGAEIEAGGG
jgi:PAS domain S-box-containing protein